MAQKEKEETKKSRSNHLQESLETISPPKQWSSNSHQEEHDTIGITKFQNQNIFSNHELQKNQERNQKGERNTRKAADQVDQPKNGTAKDPAVRNNLTTHNL